MAMTNHERVGKALDLLKSGLGPFIARELTSAYKDRALAEARRLLPADDRLNSNRMIDQWDVAILLKVMWDAWNDVFGRTLGRAGRGRQRRKCGSWRSLSGQKGADAKLNMVPALTTDTSSKTSSLVVESSLATTTLTSDTFRSSPQSACRCVSMPPMWGG